MTITHLNPPSMPVNPAFSQGTLFAPGGRLLVVGGQNGVTKDGLVGDDLGAQTRQALRNVITVLAEAGATQEDVAKLTIHLVVGQDPAAAFAAAAEVWGRHATAVTVLMVAALANPAFLVEIDGLAQVR
jgi:2-iminobutanoate/2-iminopropanoate deaminase